MHSELLQQLGPQLYDANLDAAELESKVRAVLADVLAASNRPLTRVDRERITQDIADDILGYGPLEPYLRDDDVAEVMVNGPFDIWLERKGKLVKVDGKFKDEAHLRRTIDKIVSRIGRRVDESSPMVDARLPDGSRVNAVVPPLAIDGSTLTIRKFSADPLTVNDLIKFGSLSDRTADFLDACVRGRLNVVVSGGTGAGKTTTLNVLSSFIPADERIVTIEDAAELQLKQDHVVRLESRPSNIEGKGAVTIRDLVRNSLRMRPDRIVVGEVRDASALDMLQAMNTGHDGSICTVHSNGPRDTCSRLETLVLMAGMDLPVRAIREQVASAVDLIVHQARLKDGTRRITHVTEVERMEGDVITLQDIFLFDNSAGFDSEGRSLGTLKATGLRPKFLEKMQHNNVARRPADLRHDGLPMTEASPTRAAPSSALSWRLAGRSGLRPRRAHRAGRGRRRRASTTPSRPRAPCGCSSRCPATDAVDLRAASRSRSTARTSRPRRPPPRESTEVRAHLDPGDRHQQQHEGHAHRRGQEGRPRLPRPPSRPTSRSASSPSTTPSRRWWRPTLDRDAATATPSTDCTLTRNTALYDGVLGALEAAGPGRRQRRPAQDPGALRRQGHHQHPPRRRPRRGQGSPGARSTSSPSQQGDEANQPLNAIASAGKGTVLTTADPAALTAAFAERGRRAGPPDRGHRHSARRVSTSTSSNVAGERPDRRGRRSPPRRTCRCAAPPTSRRRSRPRPRPSR